MGKDILLPIAKVYFDNNKELEVIFGTEDHHFFYKEIQAQKYCNRTGRLYFAINRSDYKKLSPKEILQKEAHKLGIKFNDSTTSTELKKLVDAKKDK